MKLNTVVLSMIALLILSSCEAGSDSDILLTNPFVGGTEGLVASFEQGSPPAETFDSGTAPFDILVKLENKGESLVAKDHVDVKITGIRPEEFSLTESKLVKN